MLFPKDLLYSGLQSSVLAIVKRVRVDEEHYHQRLHELSIHLEELHEGERSEMAKDIHDNLAATLTAIKLDISWLEKQHEGSNSEVEAKFVALREHLDNAIDTVRKVICDLRPSVLDELGLISAIEWQLSEFEKQQQIRCLFASSLEEIKLKDKRHEITVFRIFQEAINNVAKHSMADLLGVDLSHQEPNYLQLIIIDNGIGISEENKIKNGHFGILGMQQRSKAISGELEVTAVESGGTRVKLLLPLG